MHTTIFYTEIQSQNQLTDRQTPRSEQIIVVWSIAQDKLKRNDSRLTRLLCLNHSRRTFRHCQEITGYLVNVIPKSWCLLYLLWTKFLHIMSPNVFGLAILWRIKGRSQSHERVQVDYHTTRKHKLNVPPSLFQWDNIAENDGVKVLFLFLQMLKC